MDYKKAYKEALERARQFSEKPYLEDSKGIVDYIFPELKESEGEKIRKEIISALKFANVKGVYDKHIAWIEAQGEHKPANWLQELEDKLANATLKQLAEWKEKYFNEEPAEWSEEDDQYLLVCKNALAKYQVSDKWDATIISRWLEDKLKSLKDRVQPKQKLWRREIEQAYNAGMDKKEEPVNEDFKAFSNGEKYFAQYILDMIANGWHIVAIKEACNDKIKED